VSLEKEAVLQFNSHIEMDRQKIYVLLAEDDTNLGFVIKDNLENHGYRVTLCKDGEEAWKTFKTYSFNICVLDVMMPKLDGFSLAEKIRSVNSQIPILFLTAKSMKEDKITGFKTGADDYIVKPFSVEELILRMEVFLRRTMDIKEVNKYTLGSYTFDTTNLQLHRDGKSQPLTMREAEILKFFCENSNRVVKREDILNRVWGNDDYFTGRSMDVFISKLRKYLKDDPDVEIANHHGVGFKLEIKSQAN
jgi:DNA-binding response OmpR family regulator